MNVFNNRLRVFVVDAKQGLPRPHITIAVVIELLPASDTTDTERLRVPLGMYQSDHVGYASIDISAAGKLKPIREAQRHADRNGTENIAETPDMSSVIGGIRIYPIANDTVELDVWPLLRTEPDPVIIRLPIPDWIPSAPDRHFPSHPTPDLTDWRLSPGSFTAEQLSIIGEDGCEQFLPSGVTERIFRFLQLIRDPSMVPEEFTQAPASPCESYNEFQEPPKMCYSRGVLLEYEMLWKPLGHGLGELQYSLPLAPCESVNLAIIDWSRTDDVVRGEQTATDEQLLHRQRRDRVVDEAVEATVREWQEGDSFLGGTGGAGGYGQGMWGVSGTHALGTGSASSYGKREIVGQTTQRLADSVAQATSSLQRFHSTVVVQSTQAERDHVETRTVTNHNHCHAMTVLYYGVVRHYLVTSCLVRKRDAVLVDYRRLWVDLTNQTLIRKHQLVLLTVLLDLDLRKCFDVVEKLECKRREFEASRSRLPVEEYELQHFELRIHTREETELHQSIELITRFGDQVSCHVTDPKPLERSTDFSLGGEYLPRYSREREVGRPGAPGHYFIPDTENELTRSGQTDLITLKPERRLRWSDIQAIRIRVHDLAGRTYTDSSPWEIQSVRAFTQREDEFWMMYDGTGGTVTIDGPLTLEVNSYGAARSPEELLTEEERCCISRLVEHLSAHAWHYNRAIWLAEHPDERASRFDKLAFNVEGESGKLIDFIENRPVAVVGHYVAFPVYGSELSEDYIGAVEDAVPEERVLAVPTRGLFAEAKLSHCNACEKRDVTRFWKWQESPCPKPPTIEGVRPGSRNAPLPATPAAPAGRLGAEPVPAAPEPGAMLKGVLDLLGKSDIFRDMSGMEQLGPLLQKLVEGAVELEKARMQQSIDMEKAKQEQTSTNKGGASETSSAQTVNRRSTTTTNERGTRRVEHPTPEEVVDTTRALEDARERGVDTMGEMGEHGGSEEERTPRYSTFQIQITDISVPFGFGDEREVTINGRLRVLSGFTAEDEPVAGPWYSFVYQGSGTVYGTELGTSSSDIVQFSLPGSREFPAAFEDARANVSALGATFGIGLIIELYGASFRVPLHVEGVAGFGFQTVGMFTGLTRE